MVFVPALASVGISSLSLLIMSEGCYLNGAAVGISNINNKLFAACYPISASGHLPGSHNPKAALIRDQKNVVTGAFGRLQEVEALSHSVLEEDYK